MTADDQRLGEVTRAADGTYTIRFERRLGLPPERVWAALTDSAELAHWLTAVTLEPHVGGAVRVDFGDDGGAEGEVLAWDPPRLLEYTWVWEAPTVVRWELERTPDGTRLVLVHRGHPREWAGDYGAGWHAHMARLADLLEAGPERMRPWRELYESAVGAYGRLA